MRGREGVRPRKAYVTARRNSRSSIESSLASSESDDVVSSAAISRWCSNGLWHPYDSRGVLSLGDLAK
jgi:hypothetical protein